MESKIESKKHGVYQKPEIKSESKPESKTEVVKSSQQTTINIVNLRSLYPAKLRYTGRVSGKSYEWASAGSVVEVQSEDAEYLLSKKLGSSGCCGVNSNGNQLFESL